MNPGILTPPTQYATMPRGLLGAPASVPTINPAGAFDPRHIGGCTGWWDASNAESFTLNGNSVAQWRNLGAAGGAYTQGAALNQPTVTTIGPRPAIFFSPGQQLAGGPSPQSLGDPAGNVLIAFFLIRQTANIGYTARFWSIPSSQGGSGFGLYVRLLGDFFWDASESGARVRSSATGMGATPLIGRFTRSQNVASVHSNGRQIAFRSDATGSLTAPHGVQNTIIGNTAIQTVGTTCAELITFNRPLFNQEIFLIESYLARKYAVAAV